jgi:KDO2-lipid IV(A) lauroyltransferase
MSLYDDRRVVYWIRDPFWGALYHVLYRGLRLVPPRAASDMGGQLGIALARSRYRDLAARAEQNLQRLFPGLSPQARAEMLTKMWDHVGRTTAEMAVIDRLWESAELTLNNKPVFLEQVKTRRPMILVFPHLGNWELLAIAAQRFGATLNVVFEVLRNRFERSLAERSRRHLGYRLIYPDGPGIRRMIAALERGEAVGMAIDELKAGNVVAPAFGRSLPTYANVRYAERLARKFDAPVIPAYCVRTAPHAFTLTCLDPIERPSAEQLDALCESWVRAHPEQWYMLHRLRFD